MDFDNRWVIISEHMEDYSGLHITCVAATRIMQVSLASLGVCVYFIESVAI